MLAVSYKELTRADIQNYLIDFYDEKIIKFCLDIKHKLIILTRLKEDQVKAAWAHIHQENRRLKEIDYIFAAEMKDHIIGGSLFFTGALIIGGTSAEKGIMKPFGLQQSPDTLVLAAAEVKSTFTPFVKITEIKIWEK